MHTGQINSHKVVGIKGKQSDKCLKALGWLLRLYLIRFQSNTQGMKKGTKGSHAINCLLCQASRFNTAQGLLQEQDSH